MELIKRLQSQNLIHPPSWLAQNLHYLCMMGSTAYGVSSNTSDQDIYGWCIPPKNIVFPHLAGEIEGFGTPKTRFNQWSEHHIQDPGGKEYDFAIYSIVKFFDLCMENNPNMVDSLFVPDFCVMFQTKIAQHVRENRKLFLHKGSYHKFKGYAYSQLHKMSNKTRNSDKRQADIDEHGYDLKFAYHLVRLLGECEQILTTGNLDLLRDREMLKAIRRGEWSEEKVRVYFSDNEIRLLEIYDKSELQYRPDEDRLKSLLMECMEMHYGSLSEAVKIEGKEIEIIRKIKELVDKCG